MYLSSGHYTINVSASVSVRCGCSCLTVRVLVPHFLPWAGVASARLTQRKMSEGRGSCEPFALFIRFLLDTHTSCAHRRPIGPLRVRGCKVAAKINGQIQLYLYLNVTCLASHLLRHLRICTLFALFAFALRFISLFLLPKTSNNLRAKS